MNKIGHSLHWHSPAFKKVTFAEKVKNLAKDLDFKDPAVVQGMYIFKQPRIGTQVTPHQDGTFLYNDPLKLVILTSLIFRDFDTSLPLVTHFIKKAYGVTSPFSRSP